MSSCDDSDDDQEEDGEAEAGAASGSDNLAGEDEDGTVQRKLHLFRCPSIQQSIRRLWDVLPKDENGELTMDGYVEFNLRLQKCLTPEFAIERAVDSAIGDWCEDVHDGQESMTEQDFAMFLFELSSLWCGPTVSVRVYLLFLCTTFIAITEARGSHTVGLRPLDAMERLPKSFFDLLSMQGWAKQPEDEGTLTEAQALGAWYQRNLAPASEQAALLQVQRQIFQVTHDVRAVLLFRHMDGRQQDEPTVLDLVKQATHQLEKVSKAESHGPPMGLPPAPNLDGPAARLSPRAEICPLPWCPPSHARAPGGPTPAASAALAARNAAKAGAAGALALARPASGAGRQRGRSAPSAPQRSTSLALAAASSQQQVPPLGRAFDTRRSSGSRGRGLALAGRAAVGGSQGGELVARGTLEEGTSSSTQSKAKVQPPPLATVSTPESSWVISPPPSASAAGASAAGFSATSGSKGDWWQGTSLDHPDEQTWHSAELTSFIEAANFLPPYKMPKNPGDLYHKQVEPMLKSTPSAVVFAVNKWQTYNKLVPEPFERALRKLPEGVDPEAVGSGKGPLGNPSEPVWFEMNHRLQAILKKQGRRAERRRKRRLRSKLLTGRARGGAAAGRKSDGRNLREYLDRAALERAEGQTDFPAPANDEFFSKVHVQRLRKKEGAMQRLREQLQGLPPPLPADGPLVRPMYCPPPGAVVERLP